jgi:hypothetical protein
MAAIDKMGKMMFSTSLLDWLELHEISTQRWMDKEINLLDHELMWNKFYTNPHLGKVITESSMLSNDEKMKYVLNLFTTYSMIAVIIGMRRWGKTAFALWLAEQLHERGIKIYMIQTMIVLPEWITQITDPFEVDEHSFLIYDEASITLQAREAMSAWAKDVTALFAIAGHRGFSVCVVSQHSYLVDTNVFRLADILFFKRPSLEELEKDSKERVVDIFKEYIRLMTPKTKTEILFTDGERWYKFENPLPSFWSDAVSRSYRKLTDPEDVVVFVLKMKDQKMKRVQRELLMRGVKLEPAEIEAIIQNPKKYLADWKKSLKV